MNDLANSTMTTTSPPKRIDFNTPELQRKRRIRALKDRLTRWYVLVGGLAVLAAITLIFFFLAYVVVPLFQGADLTSQDPITPRSEEHTSELQSLMRISYAVFCLKKKNNQYT